MVYLIIILYILVGYNNEEVICNEFIGPLLNFIQEKYNPKPISKIIINKNEYAMQSINPFLINHILENHKVNELSINKIRNIYREYDPTATFSNQSVRKYLKEKLKFKYGIIDKKMLH